MSEEQNEKTEPGTAGVESPGKQQTGYEDCEIVETNRWCDPAQQRAVDYSRRQRQEQRSRNQPRFPDARGQLSAVAGFRIRQADEATSAFSARAGPKA